ncbi:MAG: N-acetylmuramoyl-L-alanine amidase [Gemmatimonadota bacterium]
MLRGATAILAAVLGCGCAAGVAWGQTAAAERLVVIDAGHGGVDPGARGPSGTLEKTVVLDIARRLEALLRADPSYDVRLTRTTDTLVPLADRPRFANLWRERKGTSPPSLFISLHANAHRQRSVRGVETYFLSEALTDDARRVAAFENAAQRFEESAPSDDPLGFILTDLRQNHYLRESSEGAALIQRRLASFHPGPDRGVKQAGFVVLEGAFMPAVLVELGFISNPEEEALLSSAAHQDRLAGELARAVFDFFERAGIDQPVTDRRPADSPASPVPLLGEPIAGGVRRASP